MASIKIADIRACVADANYWIMHEFPQYVNGYGEDNPPVHIGQAYGGYRIELVLPNSTGVYTIGGYETKKECYSKQAMRCQYVFLEFLKQWYGEGVNG